MDEIPWAVILPLVAVQLLLMIIALADLIRRDRTNGPKWVWALIIIFVNLIGPVIYFVAGRKES